MNITEPFVLKEDVLLIPCEQLSADMRERISYDEGDFTLSRRHGRAFAQVIDGETAALLALFREPRTIVDAVIENSRSLGKDPEAWLDELLPHIGTFLNNHVLVPHGSEAAEEIRPRYEAGAAVGGWTIVRSVSLVEDSEIYQVRKGSELAALKIVRALTPSLQAYFANEAAILTHLDGSRIAPRLIESGVADERPYMIIEWLDGVDAGVAAAQRRHDRASLIELCVSIAEAYTTLHARGVLHGDVHPRNVMVGSRAMLLDFGLSRLADQPSRVGRAGMYFFFEPEYIAGQRQGMTVPVSAAGEQYTVAALLYLMISGSHYLDFRYEREEMARQVEVEPPLPFAGRGVPPWPEVEGILARALEKDPACRFGSIAEMAARLAEVRDATRRQSVATPLTAEAHAFVEKTVQSFARGGAMFAAGYATPPKGSIYYGSAGAAMGLLRIAEVRSDPALLALASVWSSRALAVAAEEEAYTNPAMDLPRELIGEVTPYHAEAGIHAAAALVAAATGDVMAQRRATFAFLAASARPCAQLDLTLGRSGSLLAAEMLLQSARDLPEEAALRAFGSETMKAIWTELDSCPPVASPGTNPSLAHGWTGYLYAALRWCATSGDPLPPRLAGRLEELAASDAPAYAPMPGWCSGSAGMVFLFTLAHRLFDDARWLALAESSARRAWEEPCSIADLCCGSAGRAYALLNLYKHTGATEWLSRARSLANHAAAAAHSTAVRSNTLWKGELGVAVLVADLASPENARMPFFE